MPDIAYANLTASIFPNIALLLETQVHVLAVNLNIPHESSKAKTRNARTHEIQ